jgi:hypothetical protein
MRRHRILGVVTLGASVPIALLGWQLMRIGFPFTNLLLVEKMILVLALLISGVLLWRGGRAMYWTAAAAWIAVLAWCVSSLIVLIPAAGPPVSYTKDVLYLAVALPMLAYLIAQLRRTGHAS